MLFLYIPVLTSVDPDNKEVKKYLDSYGKQLGQNYTVDPDELIPKPRNHRYEALCRGDQVITGQSAAKFRDISSAEKIIII